MTHSLPFLLPKSWTRTKQSAGKNSTSRKAREGIKKGNQNTMEMYPL